MYVVLSLSLSPHDSQVYFYRISDIQWLLLDDARNKLLRRGVDVEEYSLTFREGYATRRSSPYIQTNVAYSPSSKGFQCSQQPLSTPNQVSSQHTGAPYPQSTLQPNPSPFASQGPSGLGDTAIKIEQYQPPILNAIPQMGLAPISRGARASGGDSASNSGETESREFLLGSDPQRERIRVAKMARRLRNTLSASANTFRYSLHRQAPNALYDSSKSPPIQSCAAESARHVVNHPDNLESSAFLLENQHPFVDLPDNAGVTTIYNSCGLNQISLTTTNSHSYSPPISFPQISIPPSPHIVANSTQGNVLPHNANPVIPSVLVPNNQQWMNHPQHPSNCLSMASSELGVARTVRRTPLQQSTPFSRPEPTWPSFLKNGIVVCQWRDCGLSFYTPGAFQSHCQNDHDISGAKEVKGQCHWRGCPTPPKIMGSLVRHLSMHAGIRYFCPHRCGTEPTTRSKPHHVCVPG